MSTSASRLASVSAIAAAAAPDSPSSHPGGPLPRGVNGTAGTRSRKRACKPFVVLTDFCVKWKTYWAKLLHQLLHKLLTGQIMTGPYPAIGTCFLVFQALLDAMMVKDVPTAENSPA